MAQLTYANNISPGFPGMKVDLVDDYVRSYVNAEATAEIPFGVAVAQGASDDACILATGAGVTWVGVALHSNNYDPTYDLGTVGIKPKKTVGALVFGTVWVLVENAVTVNSRVFIRHTAGAGGTQKGAFRGDADTATAIEARGCRYLTAAAGGGVAQVQVDFNALRGIQP
jgi:hypothetical protein